MRLYTSLTSPYGRKCRMAAKVAGVGDQVQIMDIDYKAESYRELNPLGKVPALERADGSVLIDSPVISAYLASQGDEAAVLPPDPDARWNALCLEALADGISDAGVAVYLENKRDPSHRSQDWLDAQTSKINLGLDALEAVAGEFAGSTHIGILAVIASVSWLEFRTVVPDIRTGRPQLSVWLDAVVGENHVRDTAPPVGA